VFFVGILPAFFTLWVQQRVKEPAIWTASSRAAVPSPGFLSIFKSGIGGLTVVLTLMNTCTLFAWWGFNLWLPSYLKSASAQGGAGLTGTAATTYLFIMQAGMWVGYVTFGFISDRIGRKRTYVTYLLTAAVLLAVYVSVRNPAALLLLGRRKSIRRRSARPRRGSPTISAASRAPPPRTSSARSRTRMDSVRRCSSARPRSCWPRCCGSGSRKRKGGR
jgi:hypothetical protein